MNLGIFYNKEVYNLQKVRISMKKRNEIQLQQIPPTSTNLINGLSTTRMYYEQPKDSIPSTYNSLIIKQIRIGETLQQSALPPSYGNYTFQKLSPFIIFSVLKQLHVIYLILVSGFLMFQYCQAQWEMLTIQLSLTILYIFLEIACRFFTFKYYTRQNYFKAAQIMYWNRNYQQWYPIEQQDIKVGHILKISHKTKDPSEESDNTRGIRIPVNILPMKVSSRQKEVSIETFDTDKNEAAIKIPIISNFNYFFAQYFSNNEMNLVIQKYNSQCQIKYTFCNPISQSFEATVEFINDSIDKKITNADTIPRGSFLLNQDEIVGVALYNLEEKNLKHLKRILGNRNSIATLLQKHIYQILAFNLVISVIILGLNAIFTYYEIRKTFSQFYHCYFFNYFSTLCYSMNVVMYIILGLHQIIDSFLIRKKCSVHMNNYIKSVDQFGLANTFIMDQFCFIKKNILQVSSIELHQEQITRMFDQQIVLRIVQKSSEIKTKFQNQWLSLTHYYRSKYGGRNSKFTETFIIRKQKIDINGSVRLAVYFEKLDREFVFRFNQKIIFSVLQSMRIQKQIQFSQKIELGKTNGELMLMIQILEIKKQYGIDISFLMYELQFKFLGLIKLKFLPHSSAVGFLRYLKNKYNIVIKTSSTFEYFENILVSAGLKNKKDYLMIFQETEENEFHKQLTQKMDEYTKNLYKIEQRRQQNWRKGSYIMSEDNNPMNSQIVSLNQRKTVGASGVVDEERQNKMGNLIIAFHSSLILYLGRPTIRAKLKELSKISTYIIFYNCSQFQKQLCAASIFKIFPEHIFLSNFAIDSNIFRMSNLSMCIANHSSSRYTTATVDCYQNLQKFISKECVTSIQLTTIIIKSHIFKNQCLIWSMFSAMFLIYHYKYMYVGQQYSSYMVYLYNVAFTILPIFYYLIRRPQLIGDIMVQDYKDYKLRYEHLKGIISGVLITFITFSFLPDIEIEQLFIGVMINCTFMGNFYHLVLDDSIKKSYQILFIIIQCIISIGAYYFSLFVDVSHRLFTVDESVYPQPSYQALFYAVVFGLNPLIIFLLFFFMSFHKSILTKDHRIQKKQQQSKSIKSTIKKDNVVVKISKSNGKQMRFRRMGIQMC